MEFWVIVCSKCKWARGVKATSKRVRCTRCGATIDVRLARPFGKACNELDLAKAVGEVNEYLHRRGRRPAQVRTSKEYPASKTRTPKPRTKEVRETIMELARTKKEFSVEDVIQALARTHLVLPSEVERDDAVKAIDDLMTKGLIFEFKFGHYKIV